MDNAKTGDYAVADNVTRIDSDSPVNVHEGCTLLPFSLIKIGEQHLQIRYTVKSLLKLEQIFCRSLWTILEQALVGTLGEDEKMTILQLGTDTPEDLSALLDSVSREEVQRIFKHSQLEVTRAIGHEVTYDEYGNAIGILPRAQETYKRAEVRDTESFSQKKPELATFAQWYELALKTLFQIGATIPIDEIMTMMPIELEAFFSSHDRRLIYLQKMAMFEAWHVGAFLGGKEFADATPLEPILRRIDRQTEKQTTSKYTKEEARQIIQQHERRTSEIERLQQASDEQAKQSDDGV